MSGRRAAALLALAGLSAAPQAPAVPGLDHVPIAVADLSRERALFERLGATIGRRDVHVPGRVAADVARFREGEVLLLGATHQRVPGRRIVGATVRVRNIESARALLDARRIPMERGGAQTASVFVPPASAHGLWIELRQEFTGASKQGVKP